MIFRRKEHICLFYNVENLFDIHDHPDKQDSDFTPTGRLQWTAQRYEQKLKAIRDVVRNLSGKWKSPAFMGLCEVENKQVVKDLLNESPFQDRNYKIVHKESRDTRGIDLAFVYDAEVFEYLGHAWHNFESFSTAPIDGRDILEVFGKVGKTKFRFFVNHWSSRRKGQAETEYKRLAAASCLKAAIEKHFHEDDAIVILGDFNDEPKNKSIHDVLGARKKGQGDQLINLAWRYTNLGQGSIIHDDQFYLFDQIIISLNLLKKGHLPFTVKKMYMHQDPDVLIKGNPARINRTYFGTGYLGGVSDHLPVYIRIRE